MDLNKLLEQRKKSLASSAKDLSLPPAELEKIMGKVVELSLAHVHEDPKQPRQEYNPEKIEALAKSIEEKGLIQPIIVKEIDKGYLIIAGHRRYRAYCFLKKTHIPAIIKEQLISDHELTELALVENLQREDLNVLEIAKSLYVLKTAKQVTQETLSKLTGYSQANISKYLRVYEVIREHPELQDKVKSLGLKEAYEQLAKSEVSKDSEKKKKKPVTFTVKIKEGNKKSLQKALQEAEGFIKQIKDMLKAL